ncbi:MAG: DUF1499 domain-containing protein [Methyloligellaceae bacterium]
MKAIWGFRIAIVSLSALILMCLLHRLGYNTTAATFNGIYAALFGGMVSLALTVWGMSNILRNNFVGIKQAATGLILSALIVGVPASNLPDFLLLPSLNDISTDINEPPRFEALASVHSKSTDDNSQLVRLDPIRQVSAYPDIRPLVLKISGENAYSLFKNATNRLDWEIVTARSPENSNQPGLIEAVDTSALLGLKSDIAIRIVSDDMRSLIDVRAASRSGEHDLGQNADRIRQLFATVQKSMIEDASWSAASDTGNLNPQTKVREASPAREQKPGLQQDNQRSNPHIISLETPEKDLVGSDSGSAKTRLSTASTQETEKSNPENVLLKKQIFEPSEVIGAQQLSTKRASVEPSGTDSNLTNQLIDDNSTAAFDTYIPEEDLDNITTVSPQDLQPVVKKYKKKKVRRATSNWKELALPGNTE